MSVTQVTNAEYFVARIARAEAPTLDATPARLKETAFGCSCANDPLDEISSRIGAANTLAPIDCENASRHEPCSVDVREALIRVAAVRFDP
jgi:hypothetical protein